MKKKNKYVPLSKRTPKYPFGGLINQGVTGLSKMLGADEKTSQLIGSGVATATGLIPGMQDNLLQAGDLIGDIGTATKDKNLQTIGQVGRTASGLVPMFMAEGGELNIPMYYQRGVKGPDGKMQVQYYKTLNTAPTGNVNITNSNADTNNLKNLSIITPDEFYKATKETPNQIGVGTFSGDLKTDSTKRFYQPNEIKAMGGTINKVQSKTGSFYKPVYKPFEHYGQGEQFAQGGMKIYNNGGEGEGNAEVEGGETMRDPNGETEQFNGNSHEQGGIQANLQAGTQIFSDRLKSSTGKTFAKESKKYDTSKYKKIIDDKESPQLAKKTAELMFSRNNTALTKLFQEQESQKQEGFANDMFAFGGQLSYKNGGIHIKESHKGLFTKAAKNHGMGVQEYASKILAHKENYSSTIVKRANFAKNASKFKHAEGGTIDANKLPVYFADGGLLDQDFRMDGVESMAKGGTISKQAALDKMQTAKIYQRTFATGGTSPDDFTFDPTGNYHGDAEGQVLPDNNSTTSNSSSSPNWGKVATEAGIGALNNLGPATYLAQQGKSYDKQNFYGYTPKTLDPTNALRDVDNSTYSNRKAIPSMTSGSGNLAINALLANKLQGDTNKADIRQRYDEANAGITNQGQQYNIGNKYMTDDITARSKGRALTNYYSAIGNIGENTSRQTSALSREGKANQYDQASLDMLPHMFSYFQNNPERMKEFQAFRNSNYKG